jgi:aldehyde dehydrogenase (NAD+)
MESRSTSIESIPPTVARLRATFDSGRTRSYEWRRAQLKALIAMASAHSDDFASALAKDLGKPELEARSADAGQAIIEAKAALKNLRKWMRPEHVGLGLPGSKGARVLHDPLGTVLIIAPWNYPVGLLLSPAAGAIAAGNTMVLKPSEITPNVSAELARWLPEYMDNDAIALVEGGVAETTALLDERFDHIFYTGNGTVGRVVMQAAAKNLTPVTLELGGKSPCIVDRTANLELAARRIAWGKFLNAGQTCVAPDYILADEAIEAELIGELQKTVREFYGDDPSGTNDYTRVINRRHHDRLTKLLDGQTIAFGGMADPDRCYIEPTVLRDVDPSSAIMQEEIFGPILPVMRVKNTDEAIEFVNRGEKPLALYLFSNDRETEGRVLAETSSGGACINGTILHIGNSSMAFGGVGESGMGGYHGRFSFETFSHRKAVLKRGVRFDMKMMYPPYGGFGAWLVKKMF